MKLSIIYVNSGHYVTRVADEMREKGYGDVTVTHFETTLNTRRIEEFITSNLKSSLKERPIKTAEDIDDEEYQKDIESYWGSLRKVEEHRRMSGDDSILGNPSY